MQEYIVYAIVVSCLIITVKSIYFNLQKIKKNKSLCDGCSCHCSCNKNHCEDNQARQIKEK